MIPTLPFNIRNLESTEHNRLCQPQILGSFYKHAFLCSLPAPLCLLPYQSIPALVGRARPVTAFARPLGEPVLDGCGLACGLELGFRV